MIPIRQGDGTGIADVRLGDGTVIGEARTGDGDVLYTSAGAIPDSAVFRYDYEDDSNPSVGVDSFNNNDLSINGASYSTNSRFGSFGLDFDGSSDNATIPVGQSVFDSASWTLATWVRKDSTDTGNTNEGVFDYANRAVEIGYNDINNDNGFEMVINNTSAAQIGDVNIGVQNYIFLTIAYDGTAEFYYNAMSQGSVTDSISGNESSALLGDGQFQPPENGDITLDRTDLYDKRLSETEISNLYNTGSISG